MASLAVGLLERLAVIRLRAEYSDLHGVSSSGLPVYQQRSIRDGARPGDGDDVTKPLPCLAENRYRSRVPQPGVPPIRRPRGPIPLLLLLVLVLAAMVFWKRVG
jgi:hypothetical protein